MQEQLISSLAKLLLISNQHERIVYSVLMLPDNEHKDLFKNVSELLLTSEYNVKYLFNQFVLNFMVNKNRGICNQSQLNQSRCYNLRDNRPRTQSQVSINFQNRFSSALKQVLQVDCDNKELCEITVCYLKLNNTAQFWRQMHTLIPDKNHTQLREYFQNSFKRFMHQEFLDQADKLVLKELISQMPDCRPSEIAGKFMEQMQNRNYFQRNVVMYIINLKNK
ncbi:Hypothetical_protein [Hexamita inflata]|uniref:Hypothetical_protein n=1 Tax=Hexamita inflata TaxID=28002 RepID=A0AA86RP73_9EUKA|nr:Hypothetical protein HINF_LOCUS65786 [Hexamita inflata]